MRRTRSKNKSKTDVEGTRATEPATSRAVKATPEAAVPTSESRNEQTGFYKVPASSPYHDAILSSAQRPRRSEFRRAPKRLNQSMKSPFLSDNVERPSSASNLVESDRPGSNSPVAMSEPGCFQPAGGTEADAFRRRLAAYPGQGQNLTVFNPSSPSITTKQYLPPHIARARLRQPCSASPTILERQEMECGFPEAIEGGIAAGNTGAAEVHPPPVDVAFDGVNSGRLSLVTVQECSNPLPRTVVCKSTDLELAVDSGRTQAAVPKSRIADTYLRSAVSNENVNYYRLVPFPQVKAADELQTAAAKASEPLQDGAATTKSSRFHSAENLVTSLRNKFKNAQPSWLISALQGKQDHPPEESGEDTGHGKETDKGRRGKGLFRKQPPIPQPPAESSSMVRPLATEAQNTGLVQNRKSVFVSDSALQPRVGSPQGVEPLPQIRENVASEPPPSLPTSPNEKAAVSSEGGTRFPWKPAKIIRDQSASLGILNPFKTGTSGPKMVKSESWSFHEMTTPVVKMLPEDNDKLQRLQIVRTRTKLFEEEQVDKVGPMKLYQAQAYKRELEKIACEKTGYVRSRTTHFEPVDEDKKRDPDLDQVLIDPLRSRSTEKSVACPPVKSGIFPGYREPYREPGEDRFARRGSYVMATAVQSMPAPVGLPPAPRPPRTPRDRSARGELRHAKTIDVPELPPAAPPTKRPYVRQRTDNSLMSGSLGSSPASHRSTPIVPPSPVRIRQEQASKVSQLSHKRPGKDWKGYWALLTDRVLYLMRDKPDLADLSYTLPTVAEAIPVTSCIADIAYDYAKRKHVFRLACQDESEHLLQAPSADEMVDWLQCLHRHQRGDDDEPDKERMALIIKRYEATAGGAQSGSSPAMKQKRIGFPNSPQKQPSLDKAAEQQSTPSRLWKWRIKNTRSCPEQARRPIPVVEDAVFGQPLQTCDSGDDAFVPLILQLCVRVVETYGLETVGVYRIPGNSAGVNALMASLNKGFEHVDFADQRWRDVNVVSSLLKAFLRKLPDPLLTNQLYAAFIDANRMPTHEQQLTRIKRLVDKLPKHNYETLKYLLLHLQRIVINHQVNQMDAKNLAIIFGPSLLRPSGDAPTHMITHVSDQCKLVEKLIYYASWLFLEPPTSPVPPPSTGSDAPIQTTSASFADMSDLLRRVSRTEDDLEKTKENIVRSLVQVTNRRNSKAKNLKHTHELACSLSSEPGLIDVSDLIEADDGVFNERNIDDAIESSRKRRVSDGSATSANAAALPEEPHPNELAMAAEAMRKKRESDIYAARRIFIAGTEANEIIRNALTDSVAGMAVSPLSPHVVNTTGALSEVLSPETREKLRQYQSDGRAYRPQNADHSGKRPAVASSGTAPDTSKRHSRQSLDSRRESGSQENQLDSSRHSILGASGDSLSMTSDYSTTSSTIGCELHASTCSAPGVRSCVPQASHPIPAGRGSKQSSMGHLSDYSSNASPTTPRLLTPNVPLSSQMSSSVSSTSSKRQSSPEPPTKAHPPPTPLSPVDSTGDPSETPWYEVDGLPSSSVPLGIPPPPPPPEPSKTVPDPALTPTTSVSPPVNTTAAKAKSEQHSNAIDDELVNDSDQQRKQSQPERSARIAQRIRFRNRNSLTSADKRKDSRRHTVTATDGELETLQTVIRDSGGDEKPDSTNAESKQADSDVKTSQNNDGSKPFQRAGSVKLIFRRDRSTSKSAPEKVRAWFRDSFRKSNQELEEPAAVPAELPVVAATQV